MVNLNDSGDLANKSVTRSEAIKQYYATILCQTFSHDGKYLIASLKSGKLALFGISRIFDSHENQPCSDKSIYQPSISIQAHKDAIYGLTGNKSLILTGGKGEIKCWKWSDLVNQNTIESQWSITLAHGDSILRPEINSLVLCGNDETDELLLAGCGNNKIYGYDLESNQPRLTLDGHTDYINCLAYSKQSNILFSGSEDGSVCLWDLRIGKTVNTIEPYKHNELNRPFGKWIGSIALDNSSEWMVCGGGPHLSSWHLRSLSRGVVFESSSCDVTSQVALIHNDYVVSGGSSSQVSTWSLNGKIFSEIPCEPFHVYSIAIHEKDQKSLMAIGGSSYKINICTNFKYNDFHLEVF
ncbi:THO complex subunit 6 homolog [Panonychus citri]|uniref:THO complex subunit 6 homolog n=1 Tax=Panonychus citri TaxID=50023 RepID=UPI0023079067|nr:THO complex subunit 6 homolog [Panonychus citri]